jgi:hypothetical protein
MLQSIPKNPTFVTQHLYKQAQVAGMKDRRQPRTAVSNERKAISPSTLVTFPALTADEILIGVGTQFPAEETNGDYPQRIE